MTEFHFNDRYQALGMPYPEAETVCHGHCEGIGLVPVKQDDKEPVFKELWRQQHKKSHSLRVIIRVAWAYKDIRWLWQGRECDGWHFVKCPECGGTGKRAEQ